MSSAGDAEGFQRPSIHACPAGCGVGLQVERLSVLSSEHVRHRPSSPSQAVVSHTGRRLPHRLSSLPQTISLPHSHPTHTLSQAQPSALHMPEGRAKPK